MQLSLVMLQHQRADGLGNVADRGLQRGRPLDHSLAEPHVAVRVLCSCRRLGGALLADLELLQHLVSTGLQLLELGSWNHGGIAGQGGAPLRLLQAAAVKLEDPTGQGDPCIESPQALARLEDEEQGVSVQQLRCDLLADLLEHALQPVDAILRQ
eukprot:3352251-Heterocapsa_arctica.AAC.1